MPVNPRHVPEQPAPRFFGGPSGSSQTVASRHEPRPASNISHRPDAFQSPQNPQVSHPPFGLPARSRMPPGVPEKRTQVPNRRTPHPMMDAAFCVSIKTRHDRTERQSPDQHAANRDASWFFCSVMAFPFLRQRCQRVGWIAILFAINTDGGIGVAVTPRRVAQLFI